MPRHRAPAEAEEDADEEEPLEEDEELDEEEEEEDWVRLSTRARHMATGLALSAVDVVACSRKRPRLAGGVEERPQEVVGAMASPRRTRRRRKKRTTTMTSLSLLVVRRGDETKARPCGRARGPASTCFIDWRTESTGAGLTARQRKLHGVPAGVGNIVPRLRVIAPTQVGA